MLILWNLQYSHIQISICDQKIFSCICVLQSSVEIVYSDGGMDSSVDFWIHFSPLSTRVPQRDYYIKFSFFLVRDLKKITGLNKL